MGEASHKQKSIERLIGCNAATQQANGGRKRRGSFVRVSSSLPEQRHNRFSAFSAGLTHVAALTTVFAQGDCSHKLLHASVMTMTRAFDTWRRSSSRSASRRRKERRRRRDRRVVLFLFERCKRLMSIVCLNTYTLCQVSVDNFALSDDFVQKGNINYRHGTAILGMLNNVRHVLTLVDCYSIGAHFSVIFTLTALSFDVYREVRFRAPRHADQLRDTNAPFRCVRSSCGRSSASSSLSRSSA